MQICNASVKSNTHRNVNTMCYATHQIINYKRKYMYNSNIQRVEVQPESNNNERAFEHVWESMAASNFGASNKLHVRNPHSNTNRQFLYFETNI